MVAEPDTSTAADTPQDEATPPRWRQPRVWVALALLAFVAWIVLAGGLLALAARDLTEARRIALQGQQLAGRRELQQAQLSMQDAAAGFGAAHRKLAGVILAPVRAL